MTGESVGSELGGGKILMWRRVPGRLTHRGPAKGFKKTQQHPGAFIHERGGGTDVTTAGEKNTNQNGREGQKKKGESL